MKIAPSILSADFANLERDVALVEEAGADLLHIDIMDGSFVPKITMGDNVLRALRPLTKLPFDVHLMVNHPEHFLADLAEAGADLLMVHVEATSHIYRIIQQIKALGVKAGVVINPGTPVVMIKPILHLVDQVLVMTVNPGFGGQKFLPSCLAKVRELAEIKKEQGFNFDLEVDGGIDDQTIKLAATAGANVFVAGSFIYSTEATCQERMNLLRQAIKES